MRTQYLIKPLSAVPPSQRGAAAATPARLLQQYASRPGIVIARSEAELLTEETLERALALHTGEDDVPAATKPAYYQLLAEMRAGEQLVQLRLAREGRTRPSRAAPLPVRAARPVPEPPGPPASRAVGVRTLARLTGLGRLVSEWLQRGQLTSVEVRRSGRDDLYVVVDDVLRERMAEEGARQVVPEIALRGWVPAGILAQTLALRGIEVSEQGRVEATWEWLLWALAYQPAYEQHRVTTGQLIDGRTLAEHRRSGTDPWTGNLFDA